MPASRRDEWLGVWSANLGKLSSRVGSLSEAAVRKWSALADAQSCSNCTVLGPKVCFDEPDDWFPALLCLAPLILLESPTAMSGGWPV